jgi:hypothetical protein
MVVFAVGVHAQVSVDPVRSAMLNDGVYAVSSGPGAVVAGTDGGRKPTGTSMAMIGSWHGWRLWPIDIFCSSYIL